MFTFQISFDTLAAMQKFINDLSEKDLRQGKLELNPPRVVEPVAEVEEEIAAVVAATDDFPTDPTEALRRVQAASGIPACMEILAKFGVKSVGKLNDEDKADFIAACRAAVEG